MVEPRFVAEPVLRQLKDFQRRTVDYVFDRLYGDNATSRFLVADEVGLGKTMVARGVIARALEHLQDRVERVDIVYVCSNAAIAAQNVNRLNVSGQRGFAIASRLTLLPMQVHQLSANRINFVSFTPGTTFDLRSRGGTIEERALIYKMLVATAGDHTAGLLNMLQGPVRKRSNWEDLALRWAPRLDDELAKGFRDAVAADVALSERLGQTCAAFREYRDHVPWTESDERYRLIGELRNRLAQTCLHALQPDLVILDEFQRFRELLHGDDDAARLARALFSYPDVRTLLLSATPYKMLSLDHEQDDDHYPDFLKTLAFLHEGKPDVVAGVERAIQAYRGGLLALTKDADDRDERALLDARDELQRALLRVMCRTERVGMTQRLDAMVVEPPCPAPLLPDDLDAAAAVDRAARSVGAREPMEYWKSSPYLLNFLKNYDLRRKIDAVADGPSDELRAALAEAAPHALNAKQFDRYDPVEAGNARMRALFADTLDRDLWRLLWLPPSLPYTQPEGAYASVGDVTKSLVFSAWSVVPDAIAAVCSYEAERRMVEGSDRDLRHSGLYDRVKPLLRFSRGREDRLTGMPVVAWLLPSVVLAEAVDPLQIALSHDGGGAPTPREALQRAEHRITQLFDRLPPAGAGHRPDERWYWAAPILLEQGNALAEWCASRSGWLAVDGDGEASGGFREHVAHLIEVARGAIELGPRPDDLARVLAELALAGPSVCALRSLRRIAPTLAAHDPRLLSAAARVAGGFRTLFNLPESIALLRGAGEESYWRLTLQYALAGNIQALLDEQVHVLVEQLGLQDHSDADRVAGVSMSVAEALSIRTAQIRVDELTAAGPTIERTDFNTRCRFALRFGDLRGDQAATVARADTVREAFNSPFRPFVLASTSIGQEGLDFHTWCHAVVHWNLPSNPVDLEQREGRVHRYKGHAVRKNIAERYGLLGLAGWHGVGDPWARLFALACRDRAPGTSDLVPFWVYEEGRARVERRVPLMPFSREVGQFVRLKRSLALYRLVFGQPRQEDLLAHLADRVGGEGVVGRAGAWRISLAPPDC